MVPLGHGGSNPSPGIERAAAPRPPPPLKTRVRITQLFRCYGVLLTEGRRSCWSEALTTRRVEVSALRYSPGSLSLHGKTPLLRLQSDERLVALTRRGNSQAFEVLVSRYGSRLLAFCRHLLGSREDAEDVLQEVLAAAFNAILADERPIKVRPWLYRIARNRSLNHLRRNTSIGVDSINIPYAGDTCLGKVSGIETLKKH